MGVVVPPGRACSQRSNVLVRCESGGTGRRAGFRIQWGNSWGFKSPLSQTFPPSRPLRTHSEPDPVNLQVRSSGPWQHTLDIEVPSDEVGRRLDEVARQIQRRASLPGFRKGKVPLDLVRQHFAETVEQEFLENFVPKVTGEAVDQARLNPVVPPLVRGLRFTPGQPLKFEALVDVRPEIEVKDYRGLPASRRVKPVDEAAVKRVLDGIREESAVVVGLDRAAGRGDAGLPGSTPLHANPRPVPRN